MQISKLKIPTYPFPYEIVRSKRKSLVIYIRSGKAEVRAPMRAANTWIHAFLHEKTPWIVKQLALHQKMQSELLRIEQGNTVPFLGEARTIEVCISKRPSIVLNSDTLIIFTPSNTKEKLEQIFKDWLIEQAKEYMATQTIKYARQLKVEHKLKDVKFRKTKSKWGHCCQDGSIQYNWLAMMAPRDVVNYLIAHETSHLRHLNHSKRFWDTVEEICPNYIELKGWLALNGHRIWLGMPA